MRDEYCSLIGERCLLFGVLRLLCAEACYVLFAVNSLLVDIVC